MGQSISAAVKAAAAVDVEAEKQKSREDLEMLQKMVDSKLDAFQFELNERFLNPENTAKTQIPGIRPLRFQRGSYVKESEQSANEVGDAIKTFFGNRENRDSSIKDGFTEVVKNALGPFLDNTDVGQHTQEKFFIYMMHNTIVRLDVKLFRWNFAPEGIFSTVSKAVLGYIVCLSVVDPSKLKTAEFVYLISEYAGDDMESAQRYIVAMAKMYDNARKAKAEQHQSTNPQLDFHNE